MLHLHHVEASDEDEPLIHLEVVYMKTTAQLRFIQDGETKFMINMNKRGCRKWGEGLLEVAQRLTIAMD